MKNLSKFRIRFFGVHVDIDDFACRHGTILFLKPMEYQYFTGVFGSIQ
jgi:hypothetical protein